MRTLNIGSGKDYIEGAVNVDINRNVKTDVHADISDPILIVGRPEWKEAFDLIIAHDVLEHVSDLVQTMVNCKDLLTEGGEMDIWVPYDLSYQAWQDPTHVRAFNERSWQYYDEWAWYLQWTDYVLRLVKIDFILAAWVKDRGITAGEASRTPRAIEQMRVILRKVKK
jgi:SAM-dependent methyltransferase